MEGQVGTFAVKRDWPKMLKGGVIMECRHNPSTPVVAEEAGASPLWLSNAFPADNRTQAGSIACSDPELIFTYGCLTIPVMAKCRIGHFVEAANLEAIGCICVDDVGGC